MDSYDVIANQPVVIDNVSDFYTSASPLMFRGCYSVLYLMHQFYLTQLVAFSVLSDDSFAK